MQIGSNTHKELFCRWFIETHRLFDPKELPWPELDAAALARLRSVPIWDDVQAIEKRAGELIHAFAATQSDPLIRQALEVQAIEETRHGLVFASLIDRYGLDVSEKRLAFDDSERTFVEFGYKECIDAFVGYGAFRIARNAHFMPDDFMAIFTQLMNEETRHIVFFINWIAYERARRKLPWPSRILASAIGYIRALEGLIRGISISKSDAGFMGDGEAFAGLTPVEFLTTCVRENDLQMRAFGSGLLRPRVLPIVARVALGIIDVADVVHRLAHAQKPAEAEATTGSDNGSAIAKPYERL